MSSPYMVRDEVKVSAPTPPGCEEILTPEATAIKTQLAQSHSSAGDERCDQSKFPQAAQLFERMMVNPECKDFLTLEAYRYL